MAMPVSTMFLCSQATTTAAQARTQAREASTEVEHLKRDVERLLMITEALWTLLRGTHNYTDEDLVKAITEIDMRDGVYDGRVARQEALKCPSCARPVSRRHARCIYCSLPLEHAPFVR